MHLLRYFNLLSVRNMHDLSYHPAPERRDEIEEVLSAFR